MATFEKIKFEYLAASGTNFEKFGDYSFVAGLNKADAKLSGANENNFITYCEFVFGFELSFGFGHWFVPVVRGGCR